MVSGSEIYKVKVDIAVAAPARWRAICADCTGSVGSLVELLQGRLSKSVMERVCRDADGLFPAPSEIAMSCSCPDWADMCKHVAAVLYGVGARLDKEPGLLFSLRGVDHADLVVDAGAGLPRTGVASGRILVNGDVGALFGIDMEVSTVTEQPADSSAADGRSRRSRKISAREADAWAVRRPDTSRDAAARQTFKQLSETQSSKKQAVVKRTIKAGAFGKRVKMLSATNARLDVAAVPEDEKRPAHVKRPAKGPRKSPASNPVERPAASRVTKKHQAASKNNVPKGKVPKGKAEAQTPPR